MRPVSPRAPDGQRTASFAPTRARIGGGSQGRGSRRGRRPAAFGVVAASLVLAGCGASSDGPLRVAGQTPGHWVLEGFGRVEPDVPLSMGSIILCLDRPGNVTITDVAPLHPVGTITVQAFAVRPSPFMRTPPGLALGDDIGPLGKFGFHGNHVVPIVCDSRKGAGYELGLQITKPTQRPAAAAGWIVTYTSHGKRYHVQVPPEVKMCSETSADEGACGRITHESLTSG